MKIPSRISLLLLAIAVARLSASTIDVKNYGATGDGKTLDTVAINLAIQECKKAGGGTVYFPPGIYLTGTVHLVSNLTLRFDPGATILGSKNLADYQSSRPLAEGDRTNQFDKEKANWFQSLIQGKGLHDVTIIGPGTVDGNQVFNREGQAKMRGPHAILLDDCQNVTLRDVNIRDASNFAVTLLFCTGVNCDGIVATRGWDGLHLRNVKNCTISNCRLLTGDDCIAGGNNRNVTISNCILNSACSAFRFGGQDILIHHCLIYGPGESEDITSRRRGLISGFLLHESNKETLRSPLDPNRPANDNIVISDVSMSDVRNPFWIAFPSREEAGRFRISNLTAIGCGRAPFYAGGTDSPIQSVVLENVRMTFVGGADEAMTNDHGNGRHSIMPSYGIYVTNVRHLELENVRLGLDRPDARPALYAEKIGTLELERFTAERSEGAGPSIELAEIVEMRLDGRKVPTALATTVGLKLNGDRVVAESPFGIAVTARNDGPPALVEIPLTVGADQFRKSVLLDTGEEARVNFIRLKTAKVGEVMALSGGQAIRFPVMAKPVRHPVAAPYHAFQNTAATIEQWDDNAGYVRASGDYVAQDRLDQYGAIYLRAALAAEGSVIVRMDNPLSGGIRGGIIVRNDMTKPGESAGYVLLDESPTIGYGMQWDANGDGVLDHHTKFDGYTTWPNWLKLTRRGGVYTGFYSTDGKTWIKLAEVAVPDGVAQQDAGVYAHNCTVRFGEFKVSSGLKEPDVTGRIPESMPRRE
jgi:hypothetical protein